MRKSHNDLEELLTISFGFGNRHRSESFQVSTDTILLLYGEPHSNQSLKEVNGVDRGNIEFVLLFPPDATDADAAGLTILGSNCFELGGDGTVELAAFELHKPSSCLLFFNGPIVFHGIEIPFEFQIRLERMHRVGVKALSMASDEVGKDARRGRGLDGGGPDQLWD